MKVVVGIDPNAPSQSVTNLLGRLRFPATTAICASYAQLPLMPYVGSDVGRQNRIIGAAQSQRQAAERAIDSASGQLARFGIRTLESFEPGDASAKLPSAARDTGAELIAIGSQHRGALQSYLKGSIGRNLVIDPPCSILIAKTPVEPIGKIKALLAYDGSTFCGECVEELIRLAPSGISHIDVLVVDQRPSRGSAEQGLVSEADAGFEYWEHRGGLIDLAESVAGRLRKACFAADAICLAGDVNDCIRNVVQDHRLDLVILGSKGHGWLDRTIFGSVTLAQVVSEPHSLLILHPKTETSHH